MQTADYEQTRHAVCKSHMVCRLQMQQFCQANFASIKQLLLGARKQDYLEVCDSLLVGCFLHLDDRCQVGVKHLLPAVKCQGLWPKAQ